MREEAVVRPMAPTTPVSSPTSMGSAAATSGMVMEKKNKVPLIKTIVIIILSLVSVTFIGLFIWINLEYSDLSATVDQKVEAAVSEAKTEQALLDAEEAKKDVRTFAGPSDYGLLSFEYPKLWSVYIAADASNGGDFEAYLNPIEVYTVSNTTVNALRVSIRNKDFESVVAEYQRIIERKGSNLSVETITVAGTTANRYTGTIPGTEMQGVIVIFKIRDKTAVLRTDSVQYVDDFDTVLSTVRFNA